MTTRSSRTGQPRAPLGLVASLCLALACMGPGGGELAADLLGAPAWVAQGCRGNAKRICGVGSAAGVQNDALRRTAAIGRARADIARRLQARVAALLTDYAASADGVELRRSDGDEQRIADVSKQITNLALAETEVTDTWVSPSSTCYALVSLDVDAFSETVSRMQQLSPSLRTAVIERAGAAFADSETADSKPAR